MNYNTMTEQTKEVTCLQCGTVHFEISRDHANIEVKKFNHYFYSLTEDEQKETYGGKPSSIIQYEHCHTCSGTYTNFRDAEDADAPDGVTLSPIINREE